MTQVVDNLIPAGDDGADLDREVDLFLHCGALWCRDDAQLVRLELVLVANRPAHPGTSLLGGMEYDPPRLLEHRTTEVGRLCVDDLAEQPAAHVLNPRLCADTSIERQGRGV